MPFNFDVVSKNGHNALDKQLEESKRTLLKSVHTTATRPLKGYKVVVEFWSSGTELTSNMVAQVHKVNGEIFTIPINLSEVTTSEYGLEEANRQIHHYLFWLSEWERHLEAAAKAWNELEGLVK